MYLPADIGNSFRVACRRVVNQKFEVNHAIFGC